MATPCDGSLRAEDGQRELPARQTARPTAALARTEVATHLMKSREKPRGKVGAKMPALRRQTAATAVGGIGFRLNGTVVKDTNIL